MIRKASLIVAVIAVTVDVALAALLFDAAPQPKMLPLGRLDYSLKNVLLE